MTTFDEEQHRLLRAAVEPVQRQLDTLRAEVFNADGTVRSKIKLGVVELVRREAFDGAVLGAEIAQKKLDASEARMRLLLKPALRLIAALVVEQQMDIDAAMAGETTPHPDYARKQRLVDRARRFLTKAGARP